MARCGCAQGCACSVTVEDTPTVDMSATGNGAAGTPYAISGSVILVPDGEGPLVGANALKADALGLYVEEQDPAEDLIAMTFQRRGTLALDESEVWWVPFDFGQTSFVGGLTVYGSGTPTIALNQNGTQVSELIVTSTGLYVDPTAIGWTTGDAMTVEITDAGSGCSGFIVNVLR